LILPLAACVYGAGEARFRGSSESFDACVAICSAELVHDRGMLTLELRDGAAIAVATNTGDLTADGVATLASLEAALTEEAASLTASECVECGSVVQIGWVEGRLVTYDVSSDPPAALADMHSFALALRDALASCTATADVEPTTSCTPTALP